MARFFSELILRLTDAVSGPARQAAQSISGITRAVREGNRQQLQATSKAVGRQIRGLTGDLVGAAGAMGAFAFALSQPLKNSTEFESKLTTIAQKVELTRRQANDLGDEIIRASKKTNQFASVLADGVDVLAGAGLDPRIALRLIEPIGKAATAYKADVTDLATAGYAAYSNLKVPIGQVGEALDVMAKAGKEGRFEIDEMAQYMPALAAAAQAAGQSGVAGIADISAALQVVRGGTKDSAAAATDLANLLQKRTAPATARAFAKMGVDVVSELKKLEANGRTPIEAIAELTDKTLGGDLKRLGYLFEDAQVQDALRPLIQNMQKYKDIREKASNAKGEGEKDFIERMRDAAEKAKGAEISAENLSRTFGDKLRPMIGLAAAAITPFLDGLNELISAHPRLVMGTVAAIGGLLAFQGATAAFKLVSAIGKKAIIDFGLGFLEMTGFAKKAAFKGLGAMALGIDGLLTKMSTGPIVGFGRALLGLILPMTAVEGGLFGIRLALIATGVGAIVIGIALAAVWLIKHWRGVVTFFQGVGRGFTAALAPVMPALQPLLGALRDFGRWIANFFKGDPKEDWSKWGVAVGGALAAPILGLMNFAKWVGECINKVKTFFGIKGKPPNVGEEGRRRLDAGWVGGGKKPPPGRARGGPVLAGQDYMVGEEGPEIVRFPRRGQVYPNGSSPPAGGDGRGALNFSPTLHFHITGGGDAQAIAREVMDMIKREFRTVSDASFYDRDLRPA